MNSFEKFKSQLEIMELEDRLEIVAIDTVEVETGCVGVCCCVE